MTESSTANQASPPAASGAPAAKKVRVATTSLAGCFGCHMSFMDIDERLVDLIELVEFNRSPLTDIKHCGPCDVGLIEGGVCNAENVHVLREFRAQCKILVALGACAVNGGLPAQRNPIPLNALLSEVYLKRRNMADGIIPNDPGTAPAARQGPPNPRNRQDRLFHPWLPAIGRYDLEGIDGREITEGLLNHIEVAVRAFDPCLSCATHALGKMPLIVELQDPSGAIVHSLTRD